MNDLNYKETLKKCRVKINNQLEKEPNLIPYIASENSPYTAHEKSYWWTNGFWPGILWLLYNADSDEVLLKSARKFGEQLSELIVNCPEKLHHDVGFMYLPSLVIEYRVFGENKKYQQSILAANLLASRYNPCGEYLVAWNNEPDYLIADTLMNIPLLFWASIETKDPRYQNIAKKHIETVFKYLIRNDGSCAHILKFNSKTGEFIKSVPGQGNSSDSSWTRGQAWIIYGLIIAYRYTNEEIYLQKGMKVLNYYISFLLKNDYRFVLDLNGDNRLLDTSAAAIVASALIDYAEIVDEELSYYYLKIAKNILLKLDSEFANYDLNLGGILNNASESYHNKETQGCSLIYGDYFYIEALSKLENSNFISIW